MSIQTLTVDSLPTFIKRVAIIRMKWSAAEPYIIDPWFRGHSNADWGLLPGLYRYKRANEDELRSEFMRRARPLLLGEQPENDWDWYFMMQHYGVPTRLLDWTTGSLIALYFALRGNRGRTNAAVWIFDPWWLNRKILGKDEIMLVNEPEVLEYLPSVYNPLLRERPIAIVPSHISRRIVAQQSCFTIFGSIKDGLESLDLMNTPTHLAKIVIPKEYINQVLNDLRTCGIRETSVFPDLEALSRELSDEWVK